MASKSVASESLAQRAQGQASAGAEDKGPVCLENKKIIEDIGRAMKKTKYDNMENLIRDAIIEFKNINPIMPYFKKFDFDENGIMKIDIIETLTRALDVEEWWFSWKLKMNKKTNKLERTKIEKWKRYRVQAVLSAFAYHLATADELAWFWDHTGEWFRDYLIEALQEIGLDWKSVKTVVNVTLVTIRGVYPWVWSNKLAASIGKKVLERLQQKYPDLKLRRAGKDEDTRGIRNTYMMLARMSGAILSVPDIELCIEGVSVVAEWDDEKGHHEVCFSFVD